MSRGNPDKLKPVRSEQEASELGKKGGIASGKARRKKGAMRLAMEAALKAKGEDGLTMLEAGVLATVNAWIKTGDHSLLNSIRDLIGEKPRDEMDVEVKGNEAQRDLRNYMELLKKGG